MSMREASPCKHPDYLNPPLRRCYFCPNVVYAEHVTVTDSGAICYACSQREHERQEERTRGVEAAQPSAKVSGCLIALFVVPVVIAHARA